MPANALYGVSGPTTVSGSQTQPLNSFYGTGGTGNKTTNKDLPEWLRKLGMKGDAYAGGMLKPQIRYGFWYKDGKINFADGTSYKAKKQKDGSFAYTNSAGQAASYDPTDEQDAYNKKYKNSTSDQSFLDKAKNTIAYENFGVKRLWEGLKDNPTLLLTGASQGPVSTEMHNALFGTDLEARTGMLGGHAGPTKEEWAATGRSPGYAPELNQVAEAIAGWYAGQGLSGIGGGASSGAPTGSDLGVFSNGGAGGMAGVGGGNAGALAASGAITGGAGVSGIGGFGGGGAAGGAAGTGSGEGMAGWDWDTIINTGGTLLGAYMAGQGGKDAGETSAAGALAAVDEQRRQYDTSRADQMPWLEAGRGALNRLNDPNANFAASPDYAFRREEGTRDIGNSFAARGGALSGNALRGLTEFNSGLASGEFGNWWNRQAGLAGVGQTAASNLGTLGANTANNVGNALQNGANARASGIVDQTNAYTGGLADLMSTWNRYRAPNRGG